MKNMLRYPLQRRIFITVSLLVLLPYLALSLLLFVYYRNDQEEQKNQQYTSMLHVAEMIINRNLAQIENTVNSLTTSRSIKKALRGKNKNEMAITLIYDVPEDLGIGAASLREYHAEIHLVTLDDNTFERYNQFYHLSRFREDSEFITFVEESAVTAWLSPRIYTGGAPIYTSSNHTVISFCHKVKELSQTLGVIMCSVRVEDIFFSALQEMSQYGTAQIMQNGVCIYKMKDGKVLDTEGEPEDSPSAARFSTQSLHYPYQISLEVSDSKTESTIYILNFFLSSCLAYIAIMAIITGVLNTLLKKLNFVSELLLVMDPNLDGQRVPCLGKNEINTLGTSINKLLSKMEAQRHELLESERDRRRAERSALQLQMNPHLLFNSLHWLELSLSEESRNVQQGVELLGELYRYNLMGENFVGIDDEIKNAGSYVRMMCLLKDRSMSLDVTCPEELRTGSILRFTLQPIVENAIKHGLQKKASINIHVRFATEGAMLIITVSNDGLPIPPERLQEINSSLSRRKAANHIGLLNLAQRLYLTYGDEAVLQLDSENGITAVTVCVPYGGAMS